MLQIEEILEEENIEKLKEHLNSYIVVKDFNEKRGIMDEQFCAEYNLVLNYFKELGGDINDYKKQ